MIVGTGFGCRIQIPALHEAGFEVVGMVGKDVERTAKRAQDNGVPRSFTDLEEAILTIGARAVTIATPPHTHADLALTSIGMGCHLMCEKPSGADAAEAPAMLIAAESAAIVHVVGHEFRWIRSVLRSPGLFTAA